MRGSETLDLCFMNNAEQVLQTTIRDKLEDLTGTKKSDHILVHIITDQKQPQVYEKKVHHA